MEGKMKDELWTKLIQLLFKLCTSMVLMSIVVIGIYLSFKQEFFKLIGFLIIALVAVELIFNSSGIKDVLLDLFNRIIGA